MSASTSRLSYTQVFDIFEQALAAPKGLRLKFTCWADARAFQSRCHNARAVDREDNQKIYSEGDPLWGRSEFDPLMCRLVQDDGTWWLYITPCVTPVAIEEISDDDLA